MNTAAFSLGTESAVTPRLSPTEEKALALLGDGIGPEIVAAAVGLSVSRISQLLSTDGFMAQVAELRYENLRKHNRRDSAYDSLEDALLEKLKDCIPFLIRPLEISKILSQINAAKRRGSSAPESIVNKSQVINLTLPVQIVQHFTTNTANQVIKAGNQDLITVQSGKMMDLLKQNSAPQLSSA